MVPKPAIEISDDLLVLFSRAERASAHTRILLDENDRWRRSVLAQLDYLLEQGAEFTKPRCRPGLAQALPRRPSHYSQPDPVAGRFRHPSAARINLS